MASERTRRLYRQALGLPMRDLSEDQWQAWCEVTAEDHGWALQFHVRRSQVKGRWVTNTSSPGVPDLWCVRDGRLVVIEAKAWGGTPSDDQLAWIAALDQVPGVDALVAWPSDHDRVLALLA